MTTRGTTQYSGATAGEIRAGSVARTGSALVGAVPSLVGVLALALLGVAAISAPALYHAALVAIMGYPYEHAFIDSEFMYAMKSCWLQGIDVYRAVPCDIIPGNRMAYSPLWQRLPFLPTDKEVYRVPVGLATDLLAILTLLVLPRARTLREAVLLSLALLSPMVVFALERNNIDVWIYLLIAAAVLLLGRGPVGRAVAYGLIFAAGLLKYYPFALFLLALRERPRIVVGIAGLAAAGLGVFVWWFWPELRASFANLPAPSPMGNSWGIVNGPQVAALALTGDPAAPGTAWIAQGLRLLLTAYLVLGALRQAGAAELGNALDAMPARARTWLLAGCILVAGCYLAGPNLNYRGIFLLPVLAGLVAVARTAPDPAFRTRLERWAILVLVVLWMPVAERTVPPAVKAITGSLPLALQADWALWLVREVLWCLLARSLLSVVFREMAPGVARLLAFVRPAAPPDQSPGQHRRAPDPASSAGPRSPRRPLPARRSDAW